MSEERETELYNHLQGLSKDEVIGITIREFNENRYFREVKIGEYLKENQQLKEQRNTLACLVNDLQETLDEIREYIKEKAKEDKECTDIRYINFGEGVDYDLLKILDKVKE